MLRLRSILRKKLGSESQLVTFTKQRELMSSSRREIGKRRRVNKHTNSIFFQKLKRLLFFLDSDGAPAQIPNFIAVKCLFFQKVELYA